MQGILRESDTWDAWLLYASHPQPVWVKLRESNRRVAAVT
jgi:hypothetical protein